MKTSIQILMLVLSAGCAFAAFAGLTGLAPSSAFLTSDVAMMLYSVVGALLIGFSDCCEHRSIVVRSARPFAA
jgi:hypothetical protein